MPRERLDDHLKFAIKILEEDIQAMGYKPVVQFELEGVSDPSDDWVAPKFDAHHLDFGGINEQLKDQGILGVVKPEYWQNQWEYASVMAGQSALKAAEDLEAVLALLPSMLKDYGSNSVEISPVCWGQKGGHRPLFEKDNNEKLKAKTVHIPNAIQISVSALDKNGKNILNEKDLGNVLLHCFLKTSYECTMLYCPEEEAFSRYTLKDDYDLHEELSSPSDISTAGLGAVLFHQDKDKKGNSIVNWQQHARVEHRLGAASSKYNAYLNCVYALANLHDALLFVQGGGQLLDEVSQYQQVLPTSLKGPEGAYELFRQGTWFEEKLNRVERVYDDRRRIKKQVTEAVTPLNNHQSLGTRLKDQILKNSNTFC